MALHTDQHICPLLQYWIRQQKRLLTCTLMATVAHAVSGTFALIANTAADIRLPQLTTKRNSEYVHTTIRNCENQSGIDTMTPNPKAHDAIGPLLAIVSVGNHCLDTVDIRAEAS